MSVHSVFIYLVVGLGLVFSGCTTTLDEGDCNPDLLGQYCLTGICSELGCPCLGGFYQCQNGQLTCVPITSPKEEECDGVDNDCDGQDDFEDPDAHDACSAQGYSYCIPGIGCVDGCLNDEDCDVTNTGNTCDMDTHMCVCTDGMSSRGPCVPDFFCDNGVCLCGETTCGPSEGCKEEERSYRCTCGDTKATQLHDGGEACPDGGPTPDCAFIEDHWECRCGTQLCIEPDWMCCLDNGEYTCVDITSDPDNCGECDKKCAVCSNGACASD